MSKVHLLPASKQYKANLHSHTTLSDGKISPEAVVKGYKGTGRLYVGIYNSTGRLLSASFAAVNADNKATVTFGKVDGAAYAKVLAWDAFSKAVADYKVQNL